MEGHRPRWPRVALCATLPPVTKNQARATRNAARCAVPIRGFFEFGRYASKSFSAKVEKMTQPAHVVEAQRRQDEIIRQMTPCRRLEIAMALYRTAWDYKQAWLRGQHSEWSADQIASATRRIFQTGHAGD
jgi:hypothetical protein